MFFQDLKNSVEKIRNFQSWDIVVILVNLFNRYFTDTFIMHSVHVVYNKTHERYLIWLTSICTHFQFSFAWNVCYTFENIKNDNPNRVKTKIRKNKTKHHCSAHPLLSTIPTSLFTYISRHFVFPPWRYSSSFHKIKEHQKNECSNMNGCLLHSFLFVYVTENARIHAPLISPHDGKSQWCWLDSGISKLEVHQTFFPQKCF